MDNYELGCGAVLVFGLNNVRDGCKGLGGGIISYSAKSLSDACGWVGDIWGY